MKLGKKIVLRDGDETILARKLFMAVAGYLMLSWP